MISSSCDLRENTGFLRNLDMGQTDFNGGFIETRAT